MADKMEDVKYSSPARISDKDLGVIRWASQPFSRVWPTLLEIAEADPARWNDLLPNILGALTIGLEKAFFDVVPNNEQTSSTVENFNNVECRGLITDAIKQNRWRPLIEYVEVRLRRARDTNSPNLRLIAKLLNKQKLAAAYRSPFVGGAPLTFIRHLDQLDRDSGNRNRPRYAKAISVVQSSGVGKSRMLTEVGRRVFALPICLRRPDNPGYPLSDEPVSTYFWELKTKCGDNSPSISTLSGIADFLAAAHEIMVESLEDIVVELRQENYTRADVLGRWHQKMEGEGQRDFRVEFYKRVMERVQLHLSDDAKPGKSPKLDGTTKEETEKAVGLAPTYYERAKEAVENLMAFIKNLPSEPPSDDLPYDGLPQGPLCVTYFDEAHELGMCFWIMLRLLQNQAESVRMWYVFMGTKLDLVVSHSGFRKTQRGTTSPRPPYFALGFDQCASEHAKSLTPVKIGYFETMEHISQYGRPLWRAMLPKKGNELVNIAAFKLTAGDKGGFHPHDKRHVFAVLSQRLCLDPVIANREAVMLADRSVSHHMRLLTGLSVDNALFYTHSPSEPVLALGAALLLYDHPGQLPLVLDTLSQDLCLAGLVEKGLMGELAARFLLLTARDYAAPFDAEGHRNLLKPVHLLDVLEMLFGKDWCNDDDFKTAFSDAFVNFTHWGARDFSLPEPPPRNLLSNLWARGVIMQCCFNQTSIDFLCPVYFGSMDPGANFDCDQLSGFVIQVKNKKKGDTDTGAQRNLRPNGIIRDPEDPLPYLALLMELGTDSQYREAEFITYSLPKHSKSFQYGALKREHQSALDRLSTHRNQIPKGKKNPEDKKQLKVLEVDVQDKELQRDSYNRYLISARGSSPKTYDILTTAGIEQQFETFLGIVLPQELSHGDEIAQMWPLNHMEDHDLWITNYAENMSDEM